MTDTSSAMPTGLPPLGGTTSDATAGGARPSLRARTQAMGGFLTAMVVPNMGAFIAWGFITALFIPTGWMPNEHFAMLVDPLIKFMLPLLLAYTGGTLVHGQRGGVAGVIGAIGLVVGAEIPMLLGAMLMGPLSAWIIKRWDALIHHRIPAGFEMVINNFSLGIIGMGLCLISYEFVGPMVLAINGGLTAAVNALVSTGFLPILALLNEPAKVLFLNNVIDQGIYYPLGMQEALTAGKSIFFMVASNPEPGLGVLLAYWLFSGSKVMRETAPGAIIIHFFGGIHEIYFPYVLSKPLTLIGMIAGAGSGIAVAQLFDAGLVAGPSPGSIIAYMLLTPRGGYVGVIAAVLTATLVSFAINSVIIRASAKKDRSTTQADLDAAKARSAAMKQAGKDLLASGLGAAPVAVAAVTTIDKVVFACDAGMGSSTMGASVFRKKVQKAGLDVEVVNTSLEKIPADADVVVTHRDLLERTRMTHPSLEIIAIENFIGDPATDELLDRIQKGTNDAN